MAFSEHMFFARADLSIEGELDAGVMTQPSGAVSSIWGCAECKARIFAENRTRPGFGSLRCGTLDRSSEVVPADHPWVRRTQSWIVITEGGESKDEKPGAAEERVR